ncbi:MAG: hypothetical protein ACI89L_000862 [Phycisphaerales bacterium]|jgi:hypothetical protein
MPLGSDAKHRPSMVFLLALGLLTALAGGLRFHSLADSSFWNDELYTVRSALDMSGGNVSKALGYLPARAALALDGVDRAAVDNTKPETWKAAGIDKFALRWPHALIGLLTIPILMLAARRPLGEPAAILFGLLLAVSAWHIYWSQAARFYIPQFLFFNAALLLWIPATRARAGLFPASDTPADQPEPEETDDDRGSTPRFALAMLSAFLAFWCQPVSLMLFGILGLDWLIALVRRKPLAMTPARYAIGVAALLLCVGMLAWDMTRRTEQWTQFVGQDSWLKPHELILAVVFFTWPATAALVGAASLWLLRDRPRLGAPLVLAAVLPPVIFAAISLNKGFVGSRYAFVAMGPILAIASVALVEIWRLVRPKGGPWLAAGPVLAVVAGQVFATAIYFRSGGAYHLPMDQAAAYLAEHRDPRETVYAHEDEILRYELGDANVEFEPRSEPEWAAITEPSWFVEGTGHSGDSALLDRPGMSLQASFRLQQIHSRAEVRVYRFIPPTRDVLEP